MQKSKPEWWSFKKVVRHAKDAIFKQEGSSDSQEEDDDDEAEDSEPWHRPKSRGPPAKKNNTFRALPPTSVDGMRRWKDLTPEYLEHLYENVEDAMPEPNLWTSFIRFGTPQSNQRLFLIHRALKEMRTMLAEEMRSSSVYDSDVRHPFVME